MIQHRVIAEIDFGGHRNAFRFGLYALKLDAFLALDQFYPVQTGQKIEMPPGAAKLTIGDGL